VLHYNLIASLVNLYITGISDIKYEWMNEHINTRWLSQKHNFFFTGPTTHCGFAFCSPLAGL
jgi:hypothetical protein